MKNNLLNDRIFLFQALIFFGIFLYYFIQNFVLADEWYYLALRSIDDYAMQQSVRRLQEYIVDGQLVNVIGFFNYAYGWIYWILTSLLMLPAYFIDSPSVSIILGRQISLLFMFGSLYLISRIINIIKPSASRYIFLILIAMTLMPQFAANASKLHVHAQTLFFGLLAYYILLKSTKTNERYFLLSAVIAGISAGLKVTALCLYPLLFFTIYDRYIKQYSIKEVFRKTIVYFSVAFIVLIFCTSPTLLYYYLIDPIVNHDFNSYVNNHVINQILFFATLNTEVITPSMSLLSQTLGWYFSPVTIIFFVLLFFLLIRNDLREKRYDSFYIFFSIVIALGISFFFTGKSALYIATYVLNVLFLLPVALIALVHLKVLSFNLKLLISYSVLILGLMFDYGSGTKQLHAAYNFYALDKSDEIVRQKNTATELRQLIYPLGENVIILNDTNVIFPASSITGDVTKVFIYNDLENKKSIYKKFDYILLSKAGYYAQGSKQTEEEIRQHLIDTGYYNSKEYMLVYEKNDTLLYKLIK